MDHTLYDDLCVIGKSPFRSNIERDNLNSNCHSNCLGNSLVSNREQLNENVFIPKASSCWYLNDYHFDNDLNVYRSLKSLDKIGKQINSIRYDNCEKEINVLTPIDVDEDARKYFPITLGKSFEINAQIQCDKNPPWSVTFSPPSTGLPRPTSPWRVPTIHNRTELTKKWLPTEKFLESNLHFLSSSSSSISNNLQLDCDKLSAISTPYQAELTKLRLDRLRLEDEILMEIKRQEELERIRGPEPKWYELRDARFHYEAKKNNELLKSCESWQNLFDYRNSLKKKSDEFHQKYTDNRKYDPTNYIPVS